MRELFAVNWQLLSSEILPPLSVRLPKTKQFPPDGLLAIMVFLIVKDPRCKEMAPPTEALLSEKVLLDTVAVPVFM